MIMRGNLAYALGKDTPDTFSWDRSFEKDDPPRERMFRWSRFLFFGHAAFIVLFALLGLWLVIFLVPFSSFFKTFLGRSTGKVQHVGLPQDVRDWRLNCRSMQFGPIMAFLYWRMNRHVEHHMYAAVPFWKLRRLHNLIAHDRPEPVKGHLKGTKKVLGLIEAQRKDPSYVYRPEFPVTAKPPKMS